jgi:endo-1,4-beta-xylanase
MKIKRFLSLCSLVIFMASCAPATSPLSELPGATDEPSAPTDLPVGSATVSGRAILSDYPGLAACASQKLIPEGTRVAVSGIYQDFASVEFQNGDGIKTGFLPKSVLSDLTGDIPELTTDQIPWKPVVDYSAWSYYSPENGGEIIASPASDEQTDWVTDPAQHPVPVPLRIHFGLQNESSPWAAVRITGKPDNDPWWKDITRLDISIDETSYYLGIRDGSTEGYTVGIPLAIPADQEITLLFLDANGKQVQILDVSESVILEIDFTRYPGLNLPDGLFPNGWFQFGTTVGYPGTLKVTHLSLSTSPSGNYETSWMTGPGLAELAAPHGILIGTEYNPDMMMDERYCGVIRHDFNLGILSVFTDARVWLGPEEYDFALVDQQVNDSANYGLTLYASHLVWGSYDQGVLPDWLKEGDYSKAELLDILHTHISTLVGRYKDKVKIWSIANEAPERDRYFGADFWYDHIGSEYIEKSFQWAREADPDAVLLFNAANNESPRDDDTSYNISTLYQMVKSMKEKGIPVDAIGMQMHLFLPWLSHVMLVEEDVEATMRKFGDLGVKVMITEMDVDLHEIGGTMEEKLQIQAHIYADMMTACIRSGVCTVFATWGVDDGTSWISSPSSTWVYKNHTPDAAPLLFDIDYKPKPAYDAVRDVLLELVTGVN